MEILVYVCAVVGVAALFTAVLLGRDVWDRFSAPRWPQYVATIREAVPKTENSQSGIHYFLKVKFEYTVLKQRQGMSVLPSRWGTSDLAEAQRLLADFAPGRSVPVYVHPRSPRRTVFIPSVKPRDWVIAAFFLFIGILGCFAAFALWKKGPNQALEHNARVCHAGCVAAVAPATVVAHL